ncbi:hypothetical protein ACEPAI_6936 [Sanghuangporus weigelae]
MGSFYVADGPNAATIPFTNYTPRVAIVTGAAQGIGRAIAYRLADEGIDVVVNDIPSKQKQLDAVVEGLRDKGRRAIAVPGDISTESFVSVMVEKTALEFGSVDIMVANAGIMHFSPFLQASVESLDAIYGVNIRGIFLCYKFAALQMAKQGRGGRLLAASSLAGRQGTPHSAAYAASKFAIRGLTQSASLDLRNYGITVNCYAPGYVRTPMIYEASAADPGVKAAFESVPVAEPESIASMVAYLVKPESHFINGQTITIDGGLHFD